MVPAPLVLLSEPLPPAWVELLSERCELHIGLDLPAGRHGEVQALLTMLTLQIDAALLDRFPALRVVSNMAVGTDNVDLEACRSRGILVGNTPGVLTDATADLAMGLLLAAARNFEGAARDAREGRWGPWSPTGWLGRGLSGAQLGIVGLGAIGAALAKRARAFGMRIVYSSPRPKPVAAAALDATRLELDELLMSSDFVSLHCPLNDATRHLIDAPALEHMKKSAYLINSARGDVVDQAALTAALREGAIAGAALDVTSPEPLPPEHELYRLDNCLVLPHVGSATHGTRRAMAQRACENVVAALEGKPLPSSVATAAR
jgi:glyoxylate reductase